MPFSIRTLRWAGRPSSSTPNVPHSEPTVPSSTSVTRGLATCWPTLPVYTEAFLTMWSASSPCPHASWNRMPPLPPASTTGSSPDGAGRADSLANAWDAAVRARSSTDTSSNSSKPRVRAAVS